MVGLHCLLSEIGILSNTLVGGDHQFGGGLVNDGSDFRLSGFHRCGLLNPACKAGALPAELTPHIKKQKKWWA